MVLTDTGWLVMLEARQQRGLEIAATSKIERKGGAWLVPSQSRKARFTVVHDEPRSFMTNLREARAKGYVTKAPHYNSTLPLKAI